MQDPSQKFVERFCAVWANRWMVLCTFQIHTNTFCVRLRCEIDTIYTFCMACTLHHKSVNKNNKHCFPIVFDTLIVGIDAYFSLNVSGGMGGCFLHNLCESSIFLHDVFSLIVGKVWNQRYWRWETKEPNLTSCVQEPRKNTLKTNVKRRLFNWPVKPNCEDLVGKLGVCGMS